MTLEEKIAERLQPGTLRDSLTGFWIAIKIASMAQVIVRNLDDRVVAALKRKAELHGRSLEQELREVLASAARLSGPERVQLAKRIQAMTPRGVRQTDSAKLIREDRDSR